MFPNLFSEITLGKTRLKNRIVSTGHHTYLADKQPGDALIAYHEARARGGAGLIISEIVAVHSTAGFSSQLLSLLDDSGIVAYRQLADTCHQHECKLFAQLFHPGREILSTPGGMMPIAYAPSAVPNERFRIMPKPMSIKLIEDVIEGFAQTALRLSHAGFDGVELVGSHGYLIAQFLSPLSNQRDDRYGGDFERRLCFVKDCINAIRKLVPDMTIGLRLSSNDYEPDGLDESAVSNICIALEDSLDYFSLVVGSSATLGASVHVSAPMGLPAAYVAPQAAIIKKNLHKPVIVTGRINQPQEAEQIIASGQADLCGMTRAMICDPQMPAKALRGELDEIRACIACNQSCIGRAHKGLGISCIQYPESGRELQFPEVVAIDSKSKLISIIGAGPAGLKAALVAHRRGHKVTLYEKDQRSGGQVLLAQLLPGREEFGGMITNLNNQLEKSGVIVKTGSCITREPLTELNTDLIVLATGAKRYMPAFDMIDPDQTWHYHDVLNNSATIGNRVVIADWRADWIGIGLAEKLAREGCQVTLMVNASLAGESLQIYTRNHYIGRLFKLGVDIRPYVRFFGSDQSTAYFQNTLSDEPIILEEVDSVVLVPWSISENSLELELEELQIPHLSIGDCVIPRTAEDAIFEGLTLLTDWLDHH